MPALVTKIHSNDKHLFQSAHLFGLTPINLIP